MRGRRCSSPSASTLSASTPRTTPSRSGRHPLALTRQTTEAFRAQLSMGAWPGTGRAASTQPTRLLPLDTVGPHQAVRGGAALPSRRSGRVVPLLPDRAGPRTDRSGRRRGRLRALFDAVTEREMRQWFLRTTAYAERLLAGLDDLDWPERAKRLQREWIGRSEGREVDFGDLTVFTTRPDTLPAVTFLAVPAGHPAAGTAPAPPARWGDLAGAGSRLRRRELWDRSSDGSAGSRWSATGALPLPMACPSPISSLLEPGQAELVGRPAVRYRMRDWLISRQRYWGPPYPIVQLPVLRLRSPCPRMSCRSCCPRWTTSAPRAPAGRPGRR